MRKNLKGEILFVAIFILLLSSCKKNPGTYISKVQACFTINPDVPTFEDSITFNASCSQNSSKFYWYIDGVALPSIANKDINFKKLFVEGPHRVLLRTTGTNGSDTISKSFTIKPVCFGSINLQQLVYQIGDAVSPTINCNILTGIYSWDFGDGTGTVYGPTPTHKYFKGGVYVITLTQTTKFRAATSEIKVFIGHRFFDSAVVYQVPSTDSLGNAWNSGIGNPNVTFNLRASSSSTDAIPYSYTWANVDPTKPVDLQFRDTANSFELTPEVWVFTLRNDVNPGNGPFKTMHSWQRDLGRDQGNPIIFQGSYTTSPYRMQVYWHTQ
jgi:hypothetical protein